MTTRSTIPDSTNSAMTEPTWQVTPALIRRERMKRVLSLGPLLLLGLMIVGGVLFVPGFATTRNLVRVVQSQAFIGMVAVGMTFVVISGNFVDLSVGVSVAVGANFAMLFWDQSIPLALLAGLGAPICIGLANGLFVGRWSVNPIVATLGTSIVAGGALFLVTGGRYVVARDPWFQAAGRAQPSGVPVAALAFLVLLLIAQATLSSTRFGFHLRLIGANKEAARATGVPPVPMAFAVFVLSGICAAIAGFFLAGFTNQADLSLGTGYEFDALAAVVVGGTSLNGGVGSFWRTLLGVLVIGVAYNLMLLLGLNTPAQMFIKGAILILAVAIDAVANRR